MKVLILLSILTCVAITVAPSVIRADMDREVAAQAVADKHAQKVLMCSQGNGSAMMYNGVRCGK